MLAQFIAQVHQYQPQMKAVWITNGNAWLSGTVVKTCATVLDSAWHMTLWAHLTFHRSGFLYVQGMNHGRVKSKRVIKFKSTNNSHGITHILKIKAFLQTKLPFWCSSHPSFCQIVKSHYEPSGLWWLPNDVAFVLMVSWKENKGWDQTSKEYFKEISLLSWWLSIIIWVTL